MTELFTGMKEAKRALRREALARRDTLTAEEIAASSERIAARAWALPALQEAEVVLLFASIRSEVRTEALIRRCLENGQDVALPKVRSEERRLDLYLVTDLERDLRPGVWNIPEPDPDRCPEVMPRDLDFVFTPGLAFDLRGNRLGYGGGFYDKLLAQVRRDLWPEAVAALAFEVQLVSDIPHKPKDIPVPQIVTEARLILAQ
jgi:5-formyltetrahydrofolate cyclo-ligase